MARDLLTSPLLQDEQPVLDLLSNVLLASTGAALVGTDADGRVTLWNRGADTVYGYSSAEAVGRLRLADLFAVGAEPTGIAGPPGPATLAQDSWSGLISGRRKSGEAFPAQVSLTRMHGTGDGAARTGYDAAQDASGNIAGVLMVTAGVPDRVVDRGAMTPTQRYTHSIIEAIPDAIAILDAGGAVADVNDRMVALTGLSREQCVGSTSWRAVTAGRPERALLQEDGGSAAAGWLTIVDPDRPRVIVSCTATVLTDEDTDAIRILIIARDISEQRHLADASGALAAIVQSSHDAILGKNLDGVITSWNPEAERLYGYSAPEMLGQLAEILVPPNLREAEMHTLLRRIAAGERVESYETERVRKDGTMVAVSWGSSPIRDHRGQVVGAASISRDLSERERSDAAFRAVLNASADAILGVDPSGRIVLANVQTEAMFDYSREDLIGASIEMLIPDSLVEVHARHRGAYHQSPMPGRGERLGLAGCRPDGICFPVEVGLSNVDTATGPLVLATVRDVSERHRIEQELREKNLELERASRAKDNFLSSMSHELRTPLNAIIGFTGTLLMRLPGPLNTEQESQLQTVQASGKHLLMIINDLLDLARIESGRTPVTMELLDCQALAEQTAEALQPLSLAKGLRLIAEASDGPVMATTDRRAVGQILINLANNAVKFTERGEVRIRVVPAATGRPTRIMVSDTGPGVPIEDQERIFRAFERSASTAKASDEGTGLGLHISQRLANLIGAELTIASTVGEGTTFTLSVDP